MRHPKHHRCNTFPGSKALTCEDGKVNGISPDSDAEAAVSMLSMYRDKLKPV